jgi:hypothetical protein|tara:strand:- start:520 stop:696 length:177 start_codon:yes stop_codon:yes gene_type:complete
MPYKIDKINNKYKLYNLTKKEYVKKEFLTKQSAANAGINYGNYRNEKLVLKKNKLIKK